MSSLILPCAVLVLRYIAACLGGRNRKKNQRNSRLQRDNQDSAGRYIEKYRRSVVVTNTSQATAGQRSVVDAVQSLESSGLHLDMRPCVAFSRRQFPRWWRRTARPDARQLCNGRKSQRQKVLRSCSSTDCNRTNASALFGDAAYRVPYGRLICAIDIYDTRRKMAATTSTSAWPRTRNAFLQRCRNRRSRVNHCSPTFGELEQCSPYFVNMMATF